MNRLPEGIKKTIPDDLVPAVEALCKSLDDAHFRCGKVTEVFCFSLLHPGERLPEVQEHRQALGQLKAFVGPLVTQSCEQHIKTGTAPAYFHAMFEMYKAGVAVQAVRVFHDLLEIGSTHEGLLAKSPIQWAHDLALELAGVYEYRAKFWIRAVCDPPDFDTGLNWDDPDEIIMGKDWCAPMLLVMHPSRFMPFDPRHVWDRADRETTTRWLSSFADFFAIHIKLHIDRLADEETVELAKKPKSASTPKTLIREPELGSLFTEPEKPAPNVKREFRKLKTAERNKKIVAEFKKLKLRKPDESDVWYSKQLSKSPTAAGLNEETIRKIIRN